MSQSETEENPFNPGGELSVEVEPIVEAYKHRPYPTSPVGSPVRHTGGPADHPDCFVDQVEILGAGERLQNGHKVDSRPKDIKLIDGTGSNANADGTDVVKAGTLRSPKAGKPQIVHIDEKKKKCCCCAVQ